MTECYTANDHVTACAPAVPWGFLGITAAIAIVAIGLLWCGLMRLLDRMLDGSEEL